MKSKKNDKNKPTTNNRYAYWQTMLFSFFLPDVYVDAAKRWRGVGGIYILFLSFLLSIPFAIQSIQKTSNYFSERVEPAVREMPTLMFHEGKITILNKEGTPALHQSWIWPKAPSEKFKEPALLINTTKTTQSFKMYFIPILIVQDGIRIQAASPLSQKGSEPLTNIVKISPKDNRIIDSKDLNEMISGTKNNLMLTAYPYFSWILSGLAFTVSFLFAIVAPFGVLAILNYKPKFKESMRLTVVAITPAAFLVDIIGYFNQLNQQWLFLCLLLTFLYYLFGVRACRLNQEFLWSSRHGALGYE